MESYILLQLVWMRQKKRTLSLSSSKKKTIKKFFLVGGIVRSMHKMGQLGSQRKNKTTLLKKSEDKAKLNGIKKKGTEDDRDRAN